MNFLYFFYIGIMIPLNTDAPLFRHTYLEPKNREISIRDLKTKLVDFAYKNYTHLVNMDYFATIDTYNKHYLKHLKPVFIDDFKLERFFRVLVCVIHCHPCYHDVVVNWKEFNRFFSSAYEYITQKNLNKRIDVYLAHSTRILALHGKK